MAEAEVWKGMVRRVPAAGRLDRLEFHSDEEYLKQIVQVAGYTCPHCGAGVEFQERHLFDGFQGRTTTLDAEWRARFDAARPLEGLERGLEFYCPGCRAPVRIIYSPLSDLYKSFDWRLLEVVEVNEWSGDSPSGRR